MRPRDTSPDAHRAQIEIWRAMSPARRVQRQILGDTLFEAAYGSRRDSEESR